MKTNRFNWSGPLFTAGLALLAIGAATPPQPPSSFAIQLYAGLTITNTAGSACSVECNSDLSQSNNWVVLTNLTLPSSPYLYIDTTAPAYASKRFYRVSVPSTGPTNPSPDKLVSISPGTFTMGEAPNAVLVTLTQGYYISKNLVTQGEYQQVMNSNPSQNTGNTNYPVESVRWLDAKDYCIQLTLQEQAANRLPSDWAYRLPTEAEWEYACRAGTTSRFSFGDDLEGTLLGNYAWYSGNTYDGVTHRVGTKLPNPWGLYDMHGNLHQWCSDCFADILPGGTDPTGAPPSSKHVWRGGAFDSPTDACTSTYRNNDSATTQQANLGFRVVAAPVQP